MDAVRPARASPPALRHFRVLLVGETVNKLLRFAAAAVLAHALTASDFGLFNIGIAIAGIATTCSTLGLAEIGAREVSRTPERAAWIAGRVLAARTVAVTLVLLASAALAAVVWPDQWGLLGAVAAMTVAMALTGEWFARGLEQMRRVAAGTILGGAVALVGATVVGLTLGSSTAALAAFAVAEAAASLAFWTAARGRRPTVGLRGAGALLRPAAPIALSALAVYLVYANVDTIILGAVRSTAEAGYYSAAYRVFLALNVVAVFAAYAFFPLISRDEGVRSPARLAERLQPALLGLCAYGGVVLAASEVIGRPLLRLFFGTDFGRANEVLVLLCISSCWYVVGYAYGYNLIAIGRQARFSAGAVSAGLVGLILDGLLIPAHGMEGAAVATTAAIVVGTLMWLGRDGLLSPAMRPVLSALLAMTSGGVAVAAGGTSGAPVAAITLVAAAALARRSVVLRRPV